MSQITSTLTNGIRTLSTVSHIRKLSYSTPRNSYEKIDPLNAQHFYKEYLNVESSTGYDGPEIERMHTIELVKDGVMGVVVIVSLALYCMWKGEKNESPQKEIEASKSAKD